MIERLSPESAAAHTEFARLDVRDARAFAGGHLTGSGHIPADELTARRAELPSRAIPILVVADEIERAVEAATLLEHLGYQQVAILDALPGAWLEGGSTEPAVRLWRPSPFLAQVLPRLPRGRALDLAAGAGREAVFLAMHGFEVDAWDHDRDVLERAEALARRHGVSIVTAVRNLERREPDLPVGSHQVVMVFRFLHRPLLPAIARAVAPGGCLIYETFRRGQERHGRPKHPRFLLDSGELRTAFPDLRVEHYEELDPEEGPVLARLLARRDET